MAEGLVLPLRRLPPETLLPGLSPSHEANCFSLGQTPRSRLVSASTVRIVASDGPLISVRSPPVKRDKGLRASKARPFLLLPFGFFGAGGGGASSAWSSWCRCRSIAASQARICCW